MTHGQTNKKNQCCQTSNSAKKTWVPVYPFLNNTTLIFSLRESLEIKIGEIIAIIKYDLIHEISSSASHEVE